MENDVAQEVRHKDAPSIRYSLRSKLLALLLGVTIVIVLAIAFLSVDTIQRIGEAAQQSSADALRNQATEYLVELTVDNARENDLILEKVRADAQNLAEYAASIFNNPKAFAPQAYWTAADHMFVGPHGQFMNDLNDTSTIFVPNTVVIDDEFTSDLELSAYLDFVFVSVYNQDPNSVAIYMISKREFSRLYPNIGLGELVPPDFLATEDIFFTSGAPENNPERNTIWTSVYNDPAGQGLLVSAVAPVYSANNEFLGVIGIDISLDSLKSNIETSQLVSGAYSFLIDEQGKAIALPEQGYQDILGRAALEGEFSVDLSSASEGFAPVLEKMNAGDTGFADLEIDGRELFIAYAPLEGTGWSLGTVIEADKVLQAISPLQEELANETTSLTLTRLLPVGVGVVIVVLVIGLWLAYRLVNPLQQLAVAAQQIKDRQWDAPLPDSGQDEVGLLSQTLAEMASQLRELIATLEEQVTSRTQRLETVATLSERLNAILDFDQLLLELVNQVKDTFGYYHAHVYVIDENSQALVMAAGAGEAGQQMKTQGHSIALDAPTSLVARAARRNEVVSVDNVREAPDWLPNPLLPDTYSEMAVPIVSEGQVAGVLDVQQDSVAGLDEGDANLLRSLANQVAVAIRNARLFAEVESGLAEARDAQQRYVEQTWDRSRVARRGSGRVQYNLAEAADLPEAALVQARQQALAHDEMTLVEINGGDSSNGEAGHPQQALVAPITLQNMPIGNLQLHGIGPDRDFSEGELALITAVVDQVAQVAESLRLFEDTQERAGRERLIGQVSDRLRRAPDLDSLMKTAVGELSRILGPDRAFVRLGSETELGAAGNGGAATSETEQDVDTDSVEAPVQANGRESDVE